jgi:hypothetical protein
MNTSIFGIVISVSMNIFNTFLSPEKLFLGAIDRFEGCLDILWNRCNNNKTIENIGSFDEHKDPIDALAEEAVRNQLAKGGDRFSGDDSVRDAAIMVEQVDGEDPEEEYEMEYEDDDDDFEEAS